MHSTATSARIGRAAACALAIAALVLAALALAGCGSSTASGTSAPPSGDNVQRFSVDLSTGAYVPNEITAKAGVPIEITFGKGSGCVKRLVFPAFKVDADMTQGPKTLELGALKAGEYPWACGMNMKHGVLRVQ
jgi:Cu+-exporting ATPase